MFQDYHQKFRVIVKGLWLLFAVIVVCPRFEGALFMFSITVNVDIIANSSWQW